MNAFKIIALYGLYWMAIAAQGQQPFTPFNPGSQAYRAAENTIEVAQGETIERYYDIQPGQTVIAELTGTFGNTISGTTLTLRDENQQVIASKFAAGLPDRLYIPTQTNTSSAIWQVDISHTGTSTNSYNLFVYLNAGLEVEYDESFNNNSNDTIATAENIDPLFFDVLPGTGQVATVFGHYHGSFLSLDDYYSFTGIAGETIKVSLEQAHYLFPTAIEITDGQTVFYSSYLQPEAAINPYSSPEIVLPTNGTYYILVQPGRETDYALSISRDLLTIGDHREELFPAQTFSTYIDTPSNDYYFANTFSGWSSDYRTPFSRHRKSDGKLLNQFITFPTVSTARPTGIAETENTILETSRREIFEWDVTRQSILRQIPTPFDNIIAMTYANQKIYVVDNSDRKVIHVLDYLTGLIEKQLFSGLDIAYCLTNDGEKIYSIDGSRNLFSIHPITELIEILGPLTPHRSPLSLGFVDNQILVADRESIHFYDLPTRTLLFSQPVSGFRRFLGIASNNQVQLGAQGNLSLSVKANDLLRIRTFTPAAFQPSSTNTLDPGLLITDASNQVILTDLNSASDGKNVDITLPITTDATIYLGLFAENQTRGGAVVEITGASGQPPFTVLGNYPENLAGERTNTTEVVLDLSHKVDPTTVDTTDFLFDGQPPLSIQLDSDAEQIRLFIPPTTTNALHHVEVIPGSFHSAFNQPIENHTWHYYTRASDPAVISSSIQEGDQISISNLNLSVRFNLPMEPNVSTDDFFLIQNSKRISPKSFHFSKSNTVFSVSYGNQLAEAPCTFTITSAFEDRYGHRLEYFTIDFEIIDTEAIITPIDFQPIGLSGSQARVGSIINNLHNASDVDQYVLELDAEQVLAIQHQASAPLLSQLQVFAPDGGLIATTLSSTNSTPQITNLRIATPGAYIIEISGVSGQGTCQTDFHLNLQHEPSANSNEHNTAATALDLAPWFRSINQTPYTQVNLSGRTPGPGADELVLLESFESGRPTQGWTYHSDPGGRIVTSDQIAPGEGDYALYFDRVDINAAVLNEAIWHIDVSGFTPPIKFSQFVRLSPATAQSIPETFNGQYNGDGVSFSTDGQSWKKVQGFNGYNWEDRSVNLTDLATNHGLHLDNNLFLKFQDYEAPGLSEGISGIDHLRLYQYKPNADWYRFRLLPDQTATLIFKKSSSSPTVTVAGTILRESDRQVLVKQSSSEPLTLRNNQAQPVDYLLSITGNETDYTLYVSKDGNIQPEAAGVNQALTDPGFILSAQTPTCFFAEANTTRYFRFDAQAIDQVSIQTFTPGDAPHHFVNQGRPLLKILTTNQVMLATAPRAPDGRNALLSHFITTDGTYLLEVQQGSQSGEIMLQLSGNSAGEHPPLEVVSTSPAPHSDLSSSPSFIYLQFNQAIDRSSVQAAAILIDGQPPLGVEVIETDVLLLNILRLGLGTHTVQITAGAVRSLTGVPAQVDEFSFTIDPTPPRVIHASIGQYEILGSTNTTFQFTFSKQMESVLLSDILLQNDEETVQAISAIWDDTLQTLSVAFPPFTRDGRHMITLQSGTAAFRDRRNQPLDGEPNVPLTPSGDFVAGGDFHVSFYVGPPEQPLPAWTSVLPLASQVFTNQVEGLLHPDDTSDDFLFDLQYGQTINLTLEAHESARLALTLLDASATIIHQTIGNTNTVSTVLSHSPTHGGTYRAHIQSTGSNSVPYKLHFTLNAIDNRFYGDQTSNTNAVSHLSIPPGNVFGGLATCRQSVLGTIENIPLPSPSKYYVVYLTEGETVDVVHQQLSIPMALSSLELFPPGNEPSIVGTKESPETTILRRFTAGSTANYFIRVSGEPHQFNLTVCKNIRFEPLAHPNLLLTNGESALGWVGPTMPLFSASKGQDGAKVNLNQAFDRYAFSANEGERITLRVYTPLDEPSMALNHLIPQMALLDELQTELQSSSQNQIDHVVQVGQAGIFYADLSPQTQMSGTYLLDLQITTNGVPLAVTSGHPFISPSIGTNWYESGESIQASALQSPIFRSSMTSEVYCAGWTGSGDVPANGTSTNTGPFTLTVPSALNWIWKTNYFFHLATSGPGTLDQASDFHPEGTTVSVTALPEPYHTVTAWHGDTAGAITNGLTLTLPVDQSRTITAVFEPRLTPMGTPEMWLDQSNHNTADYATEDLTDKDGDGLLAWQEYQAGTDPNDPASTFVTDLTFNLQPIHQVIRWTSEAGKQYAIVQQDELGGTWTVVADQIQATPPENTFIHQATSTSRRLFRVRLDTK